MTPTDALRQLIVGLDKGSVQLASEFIDGSPDEGLPPYPWHEEWLHHARAALAAAEKDESELVKALRLLAAAKAWAAAGTADIEHCTKQTDEAVMDAEDELHEAAHEFAILAKHADSPKE